jgi:3-hydroxymyristoyl/3-hydroxydecanoyl-(acyl carrier protein) dehydratase
MPLIFERDDPALPGHFPGHAVVPGVLLLDAVIAAAGAQIAATHVVCGVERVKFVRPLGPDEPCSVETRLTGDGTIEFSCTSGDQIVATGRLRLREAGAA